MEAYSVASSYMEQARAENIIIINNKFSLWGQEWDLNGSFREISQEINRYKVFIID